MFWFCATEIAKHAFKKEVLTCFVLCHRNLGVFGEGSKMFKMTLGKQVEGLVLRFLNKFLLESIEYFMFWAYSGVRKIYHQISSFRFIENWISKIGIFYILEPSKRSDMQQ